MPKVFRTMLSDGQEPQTGADDNMLGVRVDPHPRPDIKTINGVVHPGTGGMSVSPEISKMPARLIPQRLRALYPKAIGDDELSVWTMGEGPFQDGTCAAGLTLRVDKPNRHGLVEPDTTVPLNRFQAALYATAPDWNKEA